MKPFPAAINLKIRANTNFSTEITGWLKKATENTKEKNMKCFLDI